jgi:hypothetical protein
MIRRSTQLIEEIMEIAKIVEIMGIADIMGITRNNPHIRRTRDHSIASLT